MRGKRPKTEHKRRGAYQKWEIGELVAAFCRLALDFPHENITRTQKGHPSVPRRTLSDYWASIRPVVFERMKAGLKVDEGFFFSLLHKKIMGRPTDFSPMEESFIVAEAVRAFSRAIPLTTRLLRRLGRRIYARRRPRMQGDLPMPSKGWAVSMMTRYVELLSLRKAEVLKGERAEEADVAEALMHFERLAKVMREEDLYAHPERVFAVDETAVCVAPPPREKVIVPRGARQAWRKAAKWLKHITLLFAVSMTGRKSPSCFALPYVHIPENLARETTKCGGACIATGTGWITEEAFSHWLLHLATYLDGSVRRNTGENVLLIMDMCTSHYSPEIFDFFDEHHIVPFYLPSGMTQFLQPADVGLFSAIKARYGRSVLELDRACTETDIPGIMCRAVEEACSVGVIKNAFAATGICPPDPTPVIERITQAKRCEVTIAKARYSPEAEASWQAHRGPVDEEEVDMTDDTTQTPSDWTDAGQPLKKRQRRAGLPHPGVVTLKEYTDWVNESEKAKSKGKKKETLHPDGEEEDDARPPAEWRSHKRRRPSDDGGAGPGGTVVTRAKKRTRRSEQADPESPNYVPLQKRSRKPSAIFDNSPGAAVVANRGRAVVLDSGPERPKKKPDKVRLPSPLPKRKRVATVQFDNSP